MSEPEIEQRCPHRAHAHSGLEPLGQQCALREGHTGHHRYDNVEALQKLGLI